MPAYDLPSEKQEDFSRFNPPPSAAEREAARRRSVAHAANVLLRSHLEAAVPSFEAKKRAVADLAEVLDGGGRPVVSAGRLDPRGLAAIALREAGFDVLDVADRRVVLATARRALGLSHTPPATRKGVRP
jgi:hypothetical protein